MGVKMSVELRVRMEAAAVKSGCAAERNERQVEPARRPKRARVEPLRAQRLAGAGAGQTPAEPPPQAASRSARRRMPACRASAPSCRSPWSAPSSASSASARRWSRPVKRRPARRQTRSCRSPARTTAARSASNSNAPASSTARMLFSAMTLIDGTRSALKRGEYEFKAACEPARRRTDCCCRARWC